MNHFLTNYFEVEQFIDRGIGVGQKVGGGNLLMWTERGSFRSQLEYVGVSLQNWQAKHIVIHCIFSASLQIFQLFLFFCPQKWVIFHRNKRKCVCVAVGSGFFWHSAPTHTWKRRDMHMILSSYAPDISAVGTHGHVGQFPGGLTSIVVTCYFMCVGYGMFLMFKHWFCWKCQHNKYMFNFIDHLHFYTCKWLWAPGHWFSWGPIMLLRRPCLIYIYTAVKAALSDIHICISFIHCYWQWCINKLWNV